MIDLSKEHVISLTEATERLPRRPGGKKTHIASIYRWSKQGIRGVILATVQVGGTRCTSV